MELKTTVRRTGLTTSLSKGEFVYIVSTIHRKEFGGFYQTSVSKCEKHEWNVIKPPSQLEMVYRIEVMSQLEAVQEHIDTVRMALSKDEDAWEGTKVYQDDVMNALSGSRRNRHPQEM